MLQYVQKLHASLFKIKPYARYLTRLLGYELVGEGGAGWNVSDYKIFPRRLPAEISPVDIDPYYTPTRIEINSITSRIGFSFSKDGWHPFVQTLQEYAENSDLRFEDSTLARLYNLYQPCNVQEALLDHLQEPLKPFCDWPPSYELISRVWTINQQYVIAHLNTLKNKPPIQGWIYFGPHTQEYGKLEFQRLIKVYNSIKNKGYHPELAGSDPVNGYFLQKENNSRFVLLQGNHRISAMKALGYSEADVLIRQGHPAVVDWANLDKWTEDRGGMYSSHNVRCLFDTLLNSSGVQKAQRYGLMH